MDNSLKALLLAAGVIITCLVISMGFYASGEAKNISATSTEKLNEFATELNESDITSYDGLTLMGSDVVNFIKKQVNKYSSIETIPLSIYVETVRSENTYTKEINMANIKDFSHDQYISPLGKFIGEIVRDKNDVIYKVNFIQDK